MDEVRIRALYLGGPFVLKRPWAFRHSAIDPQLYVITTGEACLRLKEGSAEATSMHLESGDVVFLPHDTPHVLADTHKTPVSPETGTASRRAAPSEPDTS